MIGDLEGYVLALAPLVAPFLMVPLQEWKSAPPLLQEWFRALRASGLEPWMLDKHFTFSERALKEGRWWTAVTYMFYHRDFDHLTGNLFGLCWMGRPVYARFGQLGLYSIFLSGGVCAAMDLQNKSFQLSEWLAKMVHNPVPRRYALSRWLDKATRGVSRWVAPYIAPYISYQGASGGVFAVMGATACLQIEDLIRILRRWPEFDIVAVALLALDVTLLVNRAASEYLLFTSGQYTGVDHAGHIDGFAVGVAGYVMLSLGKWAWRYYRRRRMMGRGRTVGRREPR